MPGMARTISLLRGDGNAADPAPILAGEIPRKRLQMLGIDGRRGRSRRAVL